MKDLEQLKEMINEVIEVNKPSLKNYESDDYEDLSEEEIEALYEDDLDFFERFKNYNFLGYSIEDDSKNLFETYEEAKNYVEKGGQILVIDKDKVYNYKEKSDEEYLSYINKNIKEENLNKKNYYGL